MNRYLDKLIAEGEHQKQDFKFAVNDSKKIARSIAAFANTDGGRLLLGVKDNGKIAGVSCDEEFYMIEAAAQMYCQPSIFFETTSHKIEGKTVLEINIPKSDEKPHKAPNKEGNYKVYIRVDDKNLLANKVLLEVWKKEKKEQNTLLQLTEPERLILTYLSEHASITFTQFRKKAKISSYKAERILVNMICMKIINIHFTEQNTYYSLSEKSHV